MTALAEFLLARIEEDKAAIYYCDSDGEFRAAWVSFYRPDGSLGYTTIAADHADGEWCADGSNLRADTRWHMKVDTPFFDAKRALAECEAKRRIVAEVESWRHLVSMDCWYTCPAATDVRDGGECCNDYAGDKCDCGLEQRTVAILAPLALPYAGHPDYREEWRV